MHVTGPPPTSSASRKSAAHSSKKAEQSKSFKSLYSTMLKGMKCGLNMVEQTSISELKAALGGAAEYLGINGLANYDTSPEATARRIADFAIGMYSIYKKQNPRMEETERLEKFEKLIKGAIDKGFQEARTVLDSLNMITKEVKSGISETYELVQKRLDNFFTYAYNSLPQQSEHPMM